MSKYIGITQTRSGYKAEYHYMGEEKYIGHFVTELLAARAYDVATPSHYPKNFPDKVFLWEEIIAENNKLMRGGNYFGVRHNPNSNRYEVRFTDLDGKTCFIGSFVSPIEAAQAFDRKNIELRGRKARTNFPLETYQ